MPQPPAGAQGRVLVVDDHQVNQALTVQMLAKLGYGADVAANGRQAVEAVARQPYGAVLMDCQMPEMDGYQAAAEIRRREDPALHVAIIAMTAAAFPQDRERCLAAGMDDYIAKPVELDDLRRTLARWLSHASLPATEPEPDTAGTEGSSPMVTQLRGAFLASARLDVARLRAAAEREDAAAMRRIAHHVKGAARTFGLDQMAACCEALELVADAGALARAGELVHRLEEELGVAE